MRIFLQSECGNERQENRLFCLSSRSEYLNFPSEFFCIGGINSILGSEEFYLTEINNHIRTVDQHINLCSFMSGFWR